MREENEILRQLKDAEDIRNLLAQYGPLADAGDSAGVASLWTEDGEYDVGGYGIARGRNAIAALIDSDTHRELMASGCAHVLSPHHIVVEGNEAVATGYSTVYRKTEFGFEPWRVASNRWELIRRDGGAWLVRKRTNRPITA